MRRAAWVVVFAALTLVGCGSDSPKTATPSCRAAFEAYESAHAAGPGDGSIAAEAATVERCASLEDWKRAAKDHQGPGRVYPKREESSLDAMLNILCGNVDFRPSGCKPER